MYEVTRANGDSRMLTAYEMTSQWSHARFRNILRFVCIYFILTLDKEQATCLLYTCYNDCSTHTTFGEYRAIARRVPSCMGGSFVFSTSTKLYVIVPPTANQSVGHIKGLRRATLLLEIGPFAADTTSAK